MMSKLLPAPLLSAGLAAMWLVLNHSLSAGHWLMALLVGWLLPLLFAPLRPQRPHIRRPLRIARYIGRVSWDVLVSILGMSRDLLRFRHIRVHSAFVVIPLDLRDPSALAALAMVTTVVPGTVWCELAIDSHAVLLHAWHVDDEAAFIEHYKRVYEAPLLEIFS